MAFPFVALMPLLGKVIDSVLPDEKAREKAKLALVQQQDGQEIQLLEVQMSAILAEAKSADPYTSRARPSFLYVVYVYILAAIPMGFLFAVSPEVAANVTTGVSSWLESIPDSMWQLFGVGYLGYTAARSVDKSRVAK
jgi:hypothetical protein